MTEHEESKKSIFRQRRWQVVFLIFFLFLTYTVSGFYLLPWVLKTQVEKRLPAVLLRPVTLKQVQFNPFTLRLQIDGFTVKAAASDKTFFKIDSLLLDIAGFLSLTNRALVLEQIDIQGPSLDVVKNRDLSYNFSDILKAVTAPSPAPEAETAASEKSGFRFSLNNITLAGGSLGFDDKTTDTVHKVTEIAISLPWISNFPQLIEEDVEPSFSAVINGTPVSAKGTSKPFKHTLETHFAINLDKLDLPYYLSYLPGERNFNLAAGTLTTRLDLVYTQKKDSKARLTLTGTVTVNDFLVSGKGKEKDYRFLSFPELVITLGSGNLLAGEIFLDEIVCRKPEIDFLHRPDGVYYLPKLIAVASSDGQGTPAAAAGKNGGQPDQKPDNELVIKLGKVRLEEGILRLYDKRVTPAFSSRFSPVDFTMENFSTITGESTQYQLQLKSDLGETLSLSGDFSLSPLKVTTHFELQNLPLPEYVTYYKNYFAGRFNGSRLGLQGDVAVAQTEAGEIRMQLHNFACELDDCRLSTPDGKPVIDLPQLEMAQCEIDFDEHTCEIGAIRGEQGSVTLIHRKDGSLNLADLMPVNEAASNKRKPEKTEPGKELSTNSATPSPAVQASDNPWHLLLHRGALQDFSIDFKDQVPARATRFQADKINLVLNQIGTGKGETGNLQLDLRLARKGTLAVAGAVGLDPVKTELSINLKKLPLPLFQNYLDSYLDLALLSGDFSTKGDLTFQESTSSGNKLGFNGTLLLDNLKTAAVDRSDELLDWHRLKLEKFVYRSQPPALSIGRVLSKGLKVNLVKDRAGRTNLEKVLRQKEVSEKAVAEEAIQTAPAGSRKPAASEDTQALPIEIQKLELVDSTFFFQDHSLSPSVEMRLDDFSGSVSGISSAGGKPAVVDLSGKLNNQAAISVSGKINPFPEELFVDLQVKGEGVGLTSVSPYSGKYVGYAVSKGKVTFDLSYKVKDYKLVAKNDIFIDQFDFGSSVESPDAMHLPIKMAVSLLRNRQGEIDLNLPVSGDLNDPEFSLGGIIVKVFVNLITKAVTSPFALISSLAGGGADLNLINFAPGQAELDDASQQNLQKLAKVLYDRPGLKVEIIGHALVPGDREALQEAHFMRLLKLQKLKEESGKKQTQDIADIVIEKDEFREYLWQAYKAAPIEKEKVLLGMVKKIDPVEQEQLLRASVKVNDDELLALATRRARAVMNFLIAKGPIEAQRLFLVAPQIVMSESGGDMKKGTQVEIKIK